MDERKISVQQVIEAVSDALDAWYNSNPLESDDGSDLAYDVSQELESSIISAIEHQANINECYGEA